MRTYGVHGWDSSVDFVEQIARKSGRLLKGGECDIKSVSKQIINDWQRGKLPWFKPPPASEQDPVAQGTSEAAPAESAETTIPNTDAEKDVVLPLPKLVQNLKNLEQKLPRCNSNKLDRSADDGALQGGKDVKKQDSDDEDEWDDLEM